MVHRDYTAPGDVEVRVYDDRIAVWNPGRLPSGLTVDQLRTPGHPSVRRNPALARVAYMAGLVERWGTGTTRMIERCRELGLPDPVFAEEGGGFRVVLRSAEAALTREALLARGLAPRLVDAVLHARRAGRITASAYMALAGVAESTALRDLRGLVEQGLLVRHGARGRGVFYTVPDTAPVGRETADSAGNTP